MPSEHAILKSMSKFKVPHVGETDHWRATGKSSPADVLVIVSSSTYLTLSTTLPTDGAADTGHITIYDC